MAKSLLDLAKQMDGLAANVGKAASGLSVEVAIAVLTDLVYVTPFDTTNALSNWHVSLNSPSHESILPYFLYARTSSAQEAIKQAIAVLKDKKPRQKIYITNSEPYIRRLNEGYSKQAPAGFAERAVLIGRLKIRNLKLVKV